MPSKTRFAFATCAYGESRVGRETNDVFNPSIVQRFSLRSDASRFRVSTDAKFAGRAFEVKFKERKI